MLCHQARSVISAVAEQDVEEWWQFLNWLQNVSRLCRKVTVTLQNMLKSCRIIAERMLKFWQFGSLFKHVYFQYIFTSAYIFNNIEWFRTKDINLIELFSNLGVGGYINDAELIFCCQLQFDTIDARGLHLALQYQIQVETNAMLALALYLS